MRAVIDLTLYDAAKKFPAGWAALEEVSRCMCFEAPPPEADGSRRLRWMTEQAGSRRQNKKTACLDCRASQRGGKGPVFPSLRCCGTSRGVVRTRR